MAGHPEALMDPARFAATLAILLIAIGLGRLVVASVGPTADGMATLFVPPDRALGWPHGVQESDEPWAWRPAAAAGTDVAAVDGGGDPSVGPPDAAAWIDPLPGRYVVPVEPVGPVRVNGRPL
jgi:hypothetical protein